MPMFTDARRRWPVQRMIANRMQEMALSCAAIRDTLTESSPVGPTLVQTMDTR
jgi:hypothetical protein